MPYPIKSCSDFDTARDPPEYPVRPFECKDIQNNIVFTRGWKPEITKIVHLNTGRSTLQTSRIAVSLLSMVVLCIQIQTGMLKFSMQPLIGRF